MALIQNADTIIPVRPLAGAGIEIGAPDGLPGWARVRPLAGAGIEISTSTEEGPMRMFAPSRGRELK